MKSRKPLTRREILHEELKAIEQAEYEKFVEKHYPSFKKFEGRYFKYRNSYGGEDKGWWLYIKVLEVKPEDVYDTKRNGAASHFTGYRFQTTSSGEILIDKKHRGYIHTSLEREISEKQFNEAWNKMICEINKLS